MSRSSSSSISRGHGEGSDGLPNSIDAKVFQSLSDLSYSTLDQCFQVFQSAKRHDISELYEKPEAQKQLLSQSPPNH